MTTRSSPSTSTRYEWYSGVGTVVPGSLLLDYLRYIILIMTLIKIGVELPKEDLLAGTCLPLLATISHPLPAVLEKVLIALCSSN